MFCQFCGAEASHELRYCKRCGGNLNPTAGLAGYEPARRPVSPLSVWGIGITTLLLVVIGLAVLFGFVSEMSGRVPPPALTFLGLFGALIILGSVGMLMRLWKYTLIDQTGAPEARRQSFGAAEPPQQLPGQHAEAFLPGPGASVTEHTTRTFQPAYREPRK